MSPPTASLSPPLSIPPIGVRRILVQWSPTCDKQDKPFADQGCVTPARRRPCRPHRRPHPPPRRRSPPRGWRKDCTWTQSPRESRQCKDLTSNTFPSLQAARVTAAYRYSSSSSRSIPPQRAAPCRSCLSEPPPADLPGIPTTLSTPRQHPPVQTSPTRPW